MHLTNYIEPNHNYIVGYIWQGVCQPKSFVKFFRKNLLAEGHDKLSQKGTGHNKLKNSMLLCIEQTKIKWDNVDFRLIF